MSICYTSPETYRLALRGRFDEDINSDVLDLLEWLEEQTGEIKLRVLTPEEIRVLNGKGVVVKMGDLELRSEAKGEAL